LFGGGAPAEPASKPAAPDTRAADAARAAEERRQQAAAAAEEKRQQAAAAAQARKEAAEQKRREAEERRQQAATAAAQARQEAAEQKRREAEERRQQAEAQAEAKRKQSEESARAARAKQAQASVEKAKPRATFSLASLFGGGSGETEDTGASSEEAPARPTVQPKKMRSPPRGTPVISEWTQNRDGSITGLISGGAGFKEGEKISTSPIGGKAIGGALVQTSSGSK
jgi:colicin import membrane protein